MNESSKHIFQIYLTDNDTDPIPQGLWDCIRNINDNRGENEHFLVRNEQLRLIIKNNFDPSVLAAYDKLIPHSFKADLGRFCLVYLYGGWYFDVSVKINRELIDVNDLRFVLFRDSPFSGINTWAAMTAAFYSKRGAKFLEYAIERIVANCKNNYYGLNCLDVTGPGVFGAAICKADDLADGIVGNYFPLTPMHENKNFAFVLPNGNILAWGKATAGTNKGAGLYAFGAAGTNSYSHLWAARQIYRE